MTKKPSKPLHVMDVRCYDNGGESFDRYTAVFPCVEGRWSYLAMSADPFSPCGFGQHGELKNAPDEYLGKVVDFRYLPVGVRNLIRMEVKSINDAAVFTI